MVINTDNTTTNQPVKGSAILNLTASWYFCRASMAIVRMTFSVRMRLCFFKIWCESRVSVFWMFLHPILQRKSYQSWQENKWPPISTVYVWSGQDSGVSHPDQNIDFGSNERKQNNMFALFEQDHLGTWSTKFKESKPYALSETSKFVAVWWLHVFVHLYDPNLTDMFRWGSKETLFDWPFLRLWEKIVVGLTYTARRNVSWVSVPKLRCWT